MGIKNLTDRGESFPEIAQIRKGAPKDDTGKIGRDLNYFRVEFSEGEAASQKTFVDRYGQTPQEIDILLPFNEIDRCWDAWLEAYTAGRMVARSDGEKFIYWIDTDTNEIKVKNGEPLTLYTDGQKVGSYTDKNNRVIPVFCKPTGRLKLVLPVLARMAYTTLITTSAHDIQNISSQLEALWQINGGRIAGIPLKLRRRPKKISVPKPDGTRARMTKWMLSIEADPAWVKAKLMEVKRLALPGNGLALLPEPEITNTEPIEEADQGDQDVYDEEDDSDIPGEPGIDSDQQQAEPVKSGTYVRPMNPEILKQSIAKKANGYVGQTCPAGKRGLMVNALEKCFAGKPASDMLRHEVCKYLTGFASTKQMTDNYALALFDWLGITNDSGGDPQPSLEAVKEANAILNLVNASNGQLSLGGAV